MLMHFATGEWGRFAQYASASTLLIAAILFGIGLWIKKDSPEKSRKLRHAAVSVIALIPITFLIVMLVTVLLFALFWKR